MNNQTFKNERNNSGADNKKALESAIRSIWQDIVFQNQTFDDEPAAIYYAVTGLPLLSIFPEISVKPKVSPPRLPL